jgi:hypothetical protein
MNKIIDYIVVCGNSAHDISGDVCYNIQHGWQPFGNLVIRDGGFVYQPMVKYAVI